MRELFKKIKCNLVFLKYLLKTPYIPGLIPGAGDTAMMKVGSCLPLVLTLAVEMQTNKRIINCECYSEKQRKGDQETTNEVRGQIMGASQG